MQMMGHGNYTIESKMARPPFHLLVYLQHTILEHGHAEIMPNLIADSVIHE